MEGDDAPFFSDEEDDHVAPAAAAGTADVDVAEERLARRQFSAEAGEEVLLFEVLELEEQLYVWAGVRGSPRLDALHAAAPPRPGAGAGAPRAAAALLPGMPGADGLALARRLATKTSKHVVLSCNLPPGEPLLQAIAERRLLQELQAARATAA